MNQRFQRPRGVRRGRNTGRAVAQHDGGGRHDDEPLDHLGGHHARRDVDALGREVRQEPQHIVSLNCLGLAIAQAALAQLL